MLRLYIALGLIAALALGGLALYAKGRIDARHAVELQTLKTQIKEADLAELHAQELEDALTDRDRQCFDAGDADGLRDHINGKD
jgi:hypothetical protein